MYGGKRLIPAPLVEFTKIYQTSDDGTKLNSIWNISITGKSLAYMGSPNSSGVFWTLGGFPPDETIAENARLQSIMRKEEAIRSLFATDGQQLEWQSENATAPIKCNPRIKEINFTKDIWWNHVEYTITAESDLLYINGLTHAEDTFEAYIESGSESWQIETDEGTPEGLGLPRTYRLTHTVSAKGKRFFNNAGALSKPAWQQAKAWVTPRLGLDTNFFYSGVNNLPSYYKGLNLIRSENVEELGGTYSVTENWVLASGNYLETFDINIRKSSDTGLTNVGIEGTITGLEVRNQNTMSITTQKYDNASVGYVMASGQSLVRAQSYAGINLNVIPLSTTVGKNPITGIINYSYEFDNRPSNIIPTSLSETISINDSLGTNVVAIIPILGRTKGPILQNVGTSRERRRTLDIEVVFPIPTGTIQHILNNGKPSINSVTSAAINSIVTAANPINNGASKSFLDDNNERWEPRTGRYSMTKTWVYEN